MFEISSIAISTIVFISALTFHEFSHALTAYLLGDTTAQRMGRLTLNPLAHIDPLGLMLLILIRFGWAKPVPFNPHNFSYPRLYSVIVGLAGPISNVFLALLSLLALHNVPVGFSPDITVLWNKLFQLSVWINIMLAVFNILPIPPLDGSHLLRVFIPPSLLPYYAQFERISFIFLIIFMSIPQIRTALVHTIYWTIEILDQIV
jgi:Zn-dependent protease